MRENVEESRFWCGKGKKEKKKKAPVMRRRPTNVSDLWDCKLNWEFNGIITERKQVSAVCPEKKKKKSVGLKL